MPTTTLGPYTVKDWLATPEGEHWELIHGNLVMTEESFGNSRMVYEVWRRIDDYLDDHPSGIMMNNIAFCFPGITDADREGVVPDLCYIPNDQLARANVEANVQKDVIPALVVEILSPSTSRIDLVDKVEIYREAGVREYWIFDRHQQTVRILRFAENAAEPVAIRSFDDTLTTPLLPGFALEMPKIRQTLAIQRKGSDLSR
ncbi:Uma2 family endonuclease [Verrucomicrobium sp. 3C]|uniref:Uma2 family endonuclease n=1 Tax=Verrucomicrobium sp. 3C TaxID=1134055 RepID=UPI00035CAE3C|nr:Uma2 family endonuclease [Verrucomicrobium sp. 3C]